MMRSLWSGVSGLQAHQVGMDVIGNNIANVNTFGFKYSRTDFASMLSQTASVATAPQGDLGGKNATQVGLGVTVASVEHIFSQGSTQNTDNPTDMAISGNGFFIVSPNGGTNNFYTRAGNFVFDALGNFVDTNGYTVQGWNRDLETGSIDTGGAVADIQITPGMVMAANETTEVTLKANLTAGLTTNQKSPAYELTSSSTTNASALALNPSLIEDVGVLFNANGKGFNLQQNQGLWVSFSPATITTANMPAFNSLTVTANSTAGASVDMTINNVRITSVLTAAAPGTQASQLMQLINQYTSQTGVTATATNNVISLFNDNTLQGDATKNIAFSVNSLTDTTGLSTNSATSTSITAYEYTYALSSPAPGSYSASVGSTLPRQFHTTEDLRAFMQWQATDSSHGGAYGATVTVDSKGQFVLSNTNNNSAATGHTTSTLNVAITSVFNSTVQAATLFTQTMSAMSGSLQPGTNILTSQSLNAATHSASTDVYDTLGSKHTMTFSFRKYDSDEWTWTATVPTPGIFDNTTSSSPNIFENPMARVKFNDNGSLEQVTPNSVTVSFANGSAGGQKIDLHWGTFGLLDGLTSFDAVSSNGNISQDGYAAGSLEDITIDQAGVIIGTFSNGQSLGLAQVAVASFANNTGLMDTGGNNFIASANSGAASVGVPGTNGRGVIQSSSLEMSNVDLSGQLTEMIVIQRGFQANSKTITTSDQMIQTLLQLKQ